MPYTCCREHAVRVARIVLKCRVEEADGEGGGGSSSYAGSDGDEDMVDADQHPDEEEDADLLREWSKNLTRFVREQVGEASAG